MKQAMESLIVGLVIVAVAQAVILVGLLRRSRRPSHD